MKKTRAQPAGPATPVTTAPARPRGLALWWGAAVALTLVCSAFFRWSSVGPWSYDEYYHFGIAREIVRDGFPDRFPWAPFSILAERFADKEPLFHLALIPLVRWPIEAAGTAVVVAGQALLLVASALLLWRGGIRRGPWFVLAMAGLGPQLAYRFGMARPHLLLVVCSVGFLVVLFARRERWRRGALLAVAAAAAVAGLAHIGGWIVVAFAAVYGLAGWLNRRGDDAARRIFWQPAAAAAVGWLVGQLVHPNFPENLRLVWLQSAVVPFQAAGAGSRELELMIGLELLPLSFRELTHQWPAFVFLAVALVRLLRRPETRTREAVTLTFLALSFVVASAFAFRRMFEMGAPLAVLAAAFAGFGAARWRWPARILAGLFLTVTIGWNHLFDVLRPRVVRPREMAVWVGANAKPEERVFTPQWADSAPLFYLAPQVHSMVVLDPTFFYVKDPRLFRLFARVSFGEVAGSRRVIREEFGARWVTLWKMPAYQALANRLLREGGARIAYEDAYYQVWDLD